LQIDSVKSTSPLTAKSTTVGYNSVSNGSYHNPIKIGLFFRIDGAVKSSYFPFHQKGCVQAIRYPISPPLRFCVFIKFWDFSRQAGEKPAKPTAGKGSREFLNSDFMELCLFFETELG
jgi:hypothetical protein